ncbi:aspartate aminotransferase family protein [soil metagenome]
MNNREIFLQHIAQTSDAPLSLEITKAEGAILFDANDRRYLDLIGGISVCNVGHGNQKVMEAIRQQTERYLHVMVNGELILSPQTNYAKLLCENLPGKLNSVFFTASGTEATEGAMKLAKRYTGRSQIVSFNKSYHGSTQGALSVMGSEYWRNAFRPLLPGVTHLTYNKVEELEAIHNETACVIAETVQAEAGVIVPDTAWLAALRKKCDDTGALLVLDEIQCGFGRNGTLWAFEQFDIVPDILLLGKALGGGMPLGAFIADKSVMQSLSHDPVLGHINTFGGHPVCCAAGAAAMNFLIDNNIVDQVFEKQQLFLRNLHSSKIKNIRSKGLMIALEFPYFDFNKKLIDALISRANKHSVGLFTDWFLFAPECLRITPPLTISDEEIKMACYAIEETLGTL